MSSINIKLDFLVVETSINTFLCKFYYYDNVNSAIKPWTAQQSTKQDALALMQTYSNDLYTALQNKEGITPLGGGSVTDYGTYSEMSFDLVVDTGSQSQEVDYTQILTSINSNLASIAAKNNQSDIVSCLNNIFCYSSNDNSNISCIKDNVNNASSNKTYLNNANIANMLRKLIRALSNYSFDYADVLTNNDKILQDISRKIFDTSPSNINNGSLSQSDFCSRLYYLIQSLMASTSNTTANIISNSLLKQISDKLANTNDLHTISQAIDLISTAIAQTPTTDTSNLEQGLNDIKTAVENKDNLLLIDGTQNFEFRKKGDEYDA